MGRLFFCYFILSPLPPFRDSTTQSVGALSFRVHSAHEFSLLKRAKRHLQVHFE